MPDRHPDHDLLRELEPVAEQLLNRHMSMAKESLPRQYVPWRLGRGFTTEIDAFKAGKAEIVTGVPLPSDFATFWKQAADRDYRRGSPRSARRLPSRRSWRPWAHCWTAEEGRHAVVLRDSLLVTRNIDPVALEREVILMRFFQDLDQDTIAAPVGYFQMRISRLQRRTLARMRFQLVEPSLAKEVWRCKSCGW